MFAFHIHLFAMYKSGAIRLLAISLRVWLILGMRMKREKSAIIEVKLLVNFHSIVPNKDKRIHKAAAKQKTQE